MNSTTIGLPCTDFASQGAGGASRSPATQVSSRGAVETSCRNSSRTRGASAPGQAMAPPMISGPTGCSTYSNPVATPKFPPPPRKAQNSSACSRSEARMIRLSAVTRSTEARLSLVQPKRRVR